MKIAIEISGHVRTFEKTFPLFKSRFLDLLKNIGEVDIFIDTWDTISTSKCWASVTAPEKNISNRINNKINKDRIVELYNPKKIIVEKYVPDDDKFNLFKTIGKTVDISPNLGENHTLWMIPMFYKIYKCNELKKEYEKENNFKYDVVIRWRFDIYPVSNFDISILNNLEYFYCEQMDYNAYGDVVWIADSYKMDKIADLYNNLKTCVSNENRGPERTVFNYVSNLNIPTKAFCTKIEFLRENENIL